MRNSRKKILILLVFCLGIRVVRAQAAEPLDECSVSSQSVQSAPCKMQRPLTEVEIEHSIHALIPTGDFIISKELFGLHIQNESHYLIRLLETLLTPITPGLAPHVFQSSCTDVMCLVNEPGIFGPRVGPKILWMLGRYGMNGSQYAYANSDQWTDREIDILLLALGDLPSSIFPLQTNRQLTHFKRGNQSTPTFSIPGHEMQKIADAGIFFYDLWDNEDPNLQRAALVHELGHALSDQYQNLSESQTWKNFSGWTLSNNRWALAAPERTVSLYAQVNPNEDFAESVAAYRYNPKSLQVRSPEKYAFIKDTVFDGLEYTSTEACDPSHAFSTVLKTKAPVALQEVLSDSKMLAELSQAVINRCNRDIFDALKETASFQVAHAMDIQTCFHDAAAGFSLSFTHDPLLQKLNNPSLSTMPALHHIRNYILSPEEYLTLQTQILTELRDAFSDFIKLLDRLKTYPTASSPSITATEFCNQYSTNSYIYTPSSIRNFLTGTPMGTSLNKIAIDGFSRQVCLDLQTDTAKITPKSNSEIEATVSAHFMP